MKHDQEIEESELNRRRGIYLLPNFFTTASLFAGFYAIVAAMKGSFQVAAIATFIAMLADSLDGRVARLTNTQSLFGAEYDSLSDMVAFGVAPALIAYSWALHVFGKLGWLAAFFYTATTGLRLAKFNSQGGNEDKRFFHGLPCPAAAGFVVGMIWIQSIYHWDFFPMKSVIAAMTVLAGLLMVSNIRYRNFKDLDVKGRVPFVALLVIVALFVAVTLDPPEILFSVFFVYALSGPIGWLLSLRKKRRFKIID